jgi:outer membrane protein OmpA-like peptidoglycan-associated protein
LDSTRVPLVTGLRIVSALHFPEGDRENLITVREASPQGATYVWRFTQQGGEGPEKGEVQRFVRASDLAAAPRLNTVFLGTGQRETPGYTSFTLSRDTYARLRAEGQTRYTITTLQRGPLDGEFSGLLASRRTLKGTLTLTSPEPRPMPVLLNGRRVYLPTLHLRGRFALQDQAEENEVWVLADSAHPLLLKIVTGPEVYQTIRIDLPEDRIPALERALADECRSELPGIYFAFARAELEPPSAPTIADVASLLDRHPDWALSVEGHTDSIGDPRSNQTLSVRRAEAVRTALVERHGVAANRLQAAGFGAMRPREPNTTLEGRARNRRVELVRAC